MLTACGFCEPIKPMANLIQTTTFGIRKFTQIMIETPVHDLIWLEFKEPMESELIKMYQDAYRN